MARRGGLSSCLCFCLVTMGVALPAGAEAGSEPAGRGAAGTPSVRVQVAEPLAGADERRTEPRLVEVAEPLGLQPEPREEQPATRSRAEMESETIERLIREWAQAWAAQDAPEYLEFYSMGFRPPQGLDRRSWESMRRERLARPRFIELEVSAIEAPETIDARRARVSFRQAYRSDQFSDVVRKTLVWVREGSSWRILEEDAEPWNELRAELRENAPDSVALR